MFEIDSTQYFIPAKPEEVTEIYYSVNTILVAPAEHSAEPTKAYIISIKYENISAFVVYIYLYLLDSGRGVIYRREEGFVSSQEYEQVIEEAFHFLESMGFILDKIDLGSLSPVEKGEYFQQQNFFPPPQEEAPEELTEELVEEDDEESSVGDGEGVEEEQASGKIGKAIRDLVDHSPEQGAISDLETRPKPAESATAKDDDLILQQWGKLLASF